MRLRILSVLAVVLTSPPAKAQMPYPPSYPTTGPGYAMPFAPGTPSPGWAGSPYAPPAMPGPVPPPPMYYGPLMPAPYPVFNPPASGKAGAAASIPFLPRKEPDAKMDHSPRREGLQGLLVKRPKAEAKTDAKPVSFAPGMPLWSDDAHGPDHAPAPDPLPPDRGPHGYRFYGKAEYLYFWVRNQRIPVLLTGQPIGGGAELPLVGGDGGLDFDNAERQGFRLTQGYWLDCHQTFALEGSFMMFGERSPSYSARSNGDLILRRPFINAATGLPDSLVVAEPGRPGGFDINTVNRMYSADLNLRCELLRACWFHTDLLLGFRFFRLEDDFNMRSFTDVLNVAFTDRFATDNTFYGAQIGFESEVQWGALFFDVWGKIALGNNHQRIRIEGNTVNNAGGVITVTPGGLFAQPSNIGDHGHDEFAVLPELGFNFGWRVLDHLRLTFGYTFLYLNRTARPGEYLDPVIDRAQAVPAPPFTLNSTGYFAHSLSAGLEFRY